VRRAQVRGYLEQKLQTSSLASRTVPGGDVVHDQQNFLTESDFGILQRDHNVVTFTIDQGPGDAVFIPAGCLHQVSNDNANTKAAMDYVTPGHVAAMIDVAGQFRK
jgi:lysine-specific demethylase 3